MGKLIRISSLTSLVVLFFAVLLIDYDTLVRRLALEISVVFSLLGYVILLRVLKKKGIVLAPWIATVVAVCVWLDAVGNFLFFYRDIIWWDQFTHFTGSVGLAIIVYIIISALAKLGRGAQGRWHIAFYSISMTMLLSTFYEITELWGDILFNMNRLSDRLDTASDLQWGLLGAILVVVFGEMIYKRKEKI